MSLSLPRLSEEFGLAEPLLLLPEAGDAAVNVEAVALMDESLFQDGQLRSSLEAGVTGKGTLSDRNPIGKATAHVASSSQHVVNPSPLTLACDSSPPLPLPLGSMVCTVLFGLATAAAGDETDAEAAREIMGAAQQSFADHDAGRRDSAIPDTAMTPTQALYKLPREPELPTLGSEKDVWRKPSAKHGF